MAIWYEYLSIGFPYNLTLLKEECSGLSKG